MLLKLLSQAFSARSKPHGRATEAATAQALYTQADALLHAQRNAEALATLRRALRQQFAPAAQDDGQLLLALTEIVWQEPPGHWRGRMTAFEQYGWLLGVLRVAPDISPLVARNVERAVDSVPSQHAAEAVDAMLRLLDFRRGSDPARIEAMMLGLVMPWMHRAAAAQRFSLALMLEKKAYAAYVIGTESEAHFRRAFALWSDLMREAGRRNRDALGPLPVARNQPPRIGFYLHSGNLMAHTRVLFDFLEALRDLDAPRLEPYVFHRGPASPALAERAAAMGVACRSLDPGTDGTMGDDYAALLELRRHVASERLDALVWVSVALHMAFAFAMRVAPVQLWWALKYHGLEYPEIDGYLTSGSAGSTKRVAGRLWRSAPLAAQDWYDPALAGDARLLRARYPQHEVLLACIGREEKLNSTAFLAAVAEVLRACPQAGFLWTGRERLPAIQSRLDSLGVGERCHYIGWVDTRTYAQVLDIFLDSFPFPCAFTLYEAMAAGRPAVTYASSEAAETGLPGLLGPLLAGESGSGEEQARARQIFGDSLYFCGQTPEEYVRMAIRLVQDAPLRLAAGQANRIFVAEFLSDRARTARILSTHLVELIDEARTGG